MYSDERDPDSGEVDITSVSAGGPSTSDHENGQEDERGDEGDTNRFDSPFREVQG